MGKKARMKELRRIASEMPEMTVNAIARERVGLPVTGKIKKSIIPVPVNHARRMKKLYNKYGANGVRVYMDAVEDYKTKNEKK